MSENRKWKCTSCDGWVGTSEQLLSAPHPFMAGETIYGCPNCQDVTDLVAACDEPGCTKEAGCGTPTPTGYRVTCGAHMPKEIIHGYK